MKPSPKLRTVHKTPPAFPLNKFPKHIPQIIGREIVYLLATKGNSSLIGSAWEEIFAMAIGAEWRDSNIGLDDVRLGNTAWGAKTVLGNPSRQKKVNLISGRNSPQYSFGVTVDTNGEPGTFGELVLSIWNDRVSAIRERFDHLRTIVLVKKANLSEVLVFEFETIRYDPELFYWSWNKDRNLKGYRKSNDDHLFTWQPHGSQFTIHENVPKSSVLIKIKKPIMLDKDQILATIGYDDSWITVIRRKDDPTV